jgi:TonB family protein
MTNMKRATILILCLFGGVQLCPAGVDPAAQQLLTGAARQANIFTEDAAPLKLESDFRVQFQVPTEGHLTMRWASKNRYWRRIIIGNFQEIDIKKGEAVYLSRNAPFTPIRIRELIGLFTVLGDPDKMQIKKARKRVEQDVAVTCFEVRFDNGRGERSHEVCVNPSSREVLSEDWNEPPDEHRRKEFSDYAEFRGHRYPRKITLLVNGSKVIEVGGLSLETAPLEEAYLTAPPGAIIRRMCDGVKHPVPVKTPDPAYPRSASQNKLMGDTTVAMTVLSDGSVDNIQLIGSGTHAMDDSTLQTLKQWKFKPAMCGSEPVAYDIEVVVSFRLY